VAQTLITDRRTAGSSYKILRRLGKGGMAEVFLARQEGMAGLRRLTVIKKILPQLSESQDVAEMLLDEARIAAQLTHPNIVQIYELGQEEGQYFIAMEFVDGCDLATLARIERHRHSRIPLRLTLRVMSEAAMALDYAHRQVSLDGRPLNLVHRDVSPHNVLCSRDGAVKVTDFGISKFAGKHQLTQVGVVKGKVQYMSPEQYRGAAVDHRSDIFSMGVVLYQLTVGKLPRVTESGQVAIKRVVEGTIPRPTSLRSEYPEELEDIVMRALANNPEERYPDAAALRDDLLDFAREHDLLAFPKELGEYVNTLVPATDLVVKEKSVIGAPAPSATPSDDDSGDHEPQVAEGRQLPSVIVEELQSEAAPHTQVASSIGRHRKTPPVRLPPEDEPAEHNTEIPITDSSIEDSEPAVLPDEDLTPFPDMDSDPFQDHTPRPRHQAPRHTPRPEPMRDIPPTKRPVVTDRIRVREDPPPPEPPDTMRVEPEPQVQTPPPMRTQTRIQKKGGVGAWVVIAVVALLIASGSLVYVFFGDRLHGTAQPGAARRVNKPKLGAGVIHIHSNPAESSVSIDGAKRCFSTPCRVAGLPLGRELLLTLRSEGHSLWMQRLVLTSHQPKLLLRADLTPLPGYKKKKPRARKKGGPAPAKKVTARPPSPRKKGGTARPPTPRKKGGAAPAKRKPMGRSAGKGNKPGNITITASGSDASVLAVDVRPWAEVWVAGQKIGFTPLVRQIPPGKYKITLKNANLKYEKTFPITVKKGKKVKIADVVAPPGK